MKRTIPPRLHVLMARDADTAVVIRRGPSRCTAFVGWNRSTDEFRVGQWLKGRIYERRCDISPDGKHLIYFAMNGRWQTETKGSWTAISRAPYLAALTLLAKGDCWHGGGLFVGSDAYWLNAGYGHEVLRDDAGMRRSPDYPGSAYYGGECPGVYYIRLQRDGWTMTAHGGNAPDGADAIFEKRINDHWTLRKIAYATIARTDGRGCYYDTHQLVGRNGAVLDREHWEWAEVDGSRLVWASNGCLYAGRMKADGMHGEKLLFDFSTIAFEPVLAPYQV